MMICPYCQSTSNQVKAGKNQSGSQRFVCKTCGKTYTPEPNSVGYPSEVRYQAIKLHENGLSFRAIARQLHVGTQSVINWVRADHPEGNRCTKKIKRPLTPHNGLKGD